MKWLFSAAFAATTLLALPAAAEPTHFRLCTGGEAGNYFRAGHMLKKVLTNLTVDVIPTQGSLDNLDRVTKGDCDGAYVQSDALLVYSKRNAQALSAIERAGVLYKEHAHLLCNRQAEISSIRDLSAKATVAVGPDGSGARTTWEAFTIADKKRYGPVNIDTRAGVRALSAVADGSQVQCALWIGSLNASFISDDAQRNSDRIMLVGSDDSDMTAGAKDNRGQPVYSIGEVPAGTYPLLQPRGWFGGKSIGTIAVDALFVTNTGWINAHDHDYDVLLRGFAAAKPAIAQLANPAR